MENSTKAIIIAGAIILILAMVSIIITVFLSNRNLIEQGTNNVDLATISYHNSQFTTYEKDNLTYANVLSLIGKIAENNNRQTNDNLKVSIELERYKPKTGGLSGIYQSDGFVTIQPTDISFKDSDTYIYLNNNSVYKGKVFKVSLMYSDLGIINKIKLEKLS